MRRMPGVWVQDWVVWSILQEARYQYGLFLRGSGREKEARLVFEDITGEAYHLSSRERHDNRAWIAKAREALKKV